MRAFRPSPGKRARRWRPLCVTLGAAAACFAAVPARAAEGPKERAISSSEVVSWLDAKDQAVSDEGPGSDEPAPPLPPRHRGFVVESSIGAFGQIGPMKNISPIAPWFHLQFGYEPLRFLMLFAEGDLMISNTSYAHPPPEPRTYSLWGVGAGLRGTLKPSDRVGLYVQSSLGGAEVNDDVLGSYGYQNADRFNLYVAAELGLEWYQVSPHLALAAHGGLRDYTATFKREQSTQPPLAWVSGVSLRYTF